MKKFYNHKLSPGSFAMSALGRKQILECCFPAVLDLRGDCPVMTFPVVTRRDMVLSAGEPCWIRTSDLLIKSQLLYRLS